MFEEDAGERIMQLMAEKKLAFRDNLKGAAKMAGQQLEFLKPSTMMITPQGLIAGPVAQVIRGTILIVLADATRVMTIHLLQPPPGTITRAGVIEDMISFVREQLTEMNAAMALHTIRIAVKAHGRKPGEASPTLDPVVIGGIVGLLLGACSDDGRRDILVGLEKVVQDDVCPVMVGLVGPATSRARDKNSGVWPLLLPLAPYIEAVIEQGDSDAHHRS